MNRNLFPSGRTPRLFALWRSARGVTVVGLIFGAVALLASIAAYEVATKKFPGLQAGFNQLAPCKRLVQAAIDGIIFNYAEKDPDNPLKPKKDANGNIVFPTGLNIPEDDPSVVAFRQCEAIQKTFSDSVKAGNFQAISELNNQINIGLQFVGKCNITSNFRVGVAGVNYSDVVEAYINFSAGSQGAGTIFASGAAAGAGGFRSTNSPNWIGNIAISADASKDAAGKTSQVIVTARTPAVKPRNQDGSCPGASIEDGGRCVQIVQLDGTCPPGQIIDGGRCLISCPTDPKEIFWKAPPLPKVNAFTVSPLSIEKGSTSPVQLNWVVSNAQSASIDKGIGEITVNPEKSVAGFRVLNPPPTESTTWTLLALGVNPGSSDFGTATLVVKEPDKPVTVAITSPAADELILEQGVTVSGVVAPVPDPDHRKAQILVNGAFLSEATIDGSGHFSARTALMNTISLGDIVLLGTNPIGVTTCGPKADTISIRVDKAGGAKNLIRVVVPLGNNQASSASVQVEHVIDVSGFHVSWSGGCGPAPGQNEGRSLVVRANQAAVQVGSVLCGFPGPAHCTDVAAITVDTGVGSRTVNQTWNANIDSCN